MKARFVTYRGSLFVTWLDSKGHGLPVEFHSRAWRRFTYRKPVIA